MNQTIEHINQYIADTLGFEVDEIEPDMDLRGDLNASDLEVSDLISLLEEVFEIEVSREEAQSLTTVGELHDLILDKLNEIS